MSLSSTTPEQTQATLDLHGRCVNDAVSDVTLFLEGVRRAVDGFSDGSITTGEETTRTRKKLFVKIITGSGSHSTHGPILRPIIQRLLEKRGMEWTLEKGGGAFQVDALSGVELHSSGGQVADSKVVVAGSEDFQQLLTATSNGNSSKGYSGLNISCAQSDTLPRNFDPLPYQVALEDEAIRVAMQLNATECLQHQMMQRYRSLEEDENDLVRAVSESDFLSQQRKSVDDTEFEESLLKIACEESLLNGEQQQKCDCVITSSDEQFEEALLLALEESAKVSSQPIKIDENDLIEQALVESKASLAEYLDTIHTEDDLLGRAIAESLVQEERRKAYEREQEILAVSQDAALIEEIKRLSMVEQEEKK